ncbi:MAG: 50S ribosomal protein L39e [Candidatus Micrarchaeia archaeon]
MSKKSKLKKDRLRHELKKNRRTPIFAIIKTKRKIGTTYRLRNWRREKLRIKA